LHRLGFASHEREPAQELLAAAAGVLAGWLETVAAGTAADRDDGRRTAAEVAVTGSAGMPSSRGSTRRISPACTAPASPALRVPEKVQQTIRARGLRRKYNVIPGKAGSEVAGGAFGRAWCGRPGGRIGAFYSISKSFM
jgi:hypothetical protein